MVAVLNRTYAVIGNAKMCAWFGKKHSGIGLFPGDTNSINKEVSTRSIVSNKNC